MSLRLATWHPGMKLEISFTIHVRKLAHSLGDGVSIATGMGFSSLFFGGMVLSAVRKLSSSGREQLPMIFGELVVKVSDCINVLCNPPHSALAVCSNG